MRVGENLNLAPALYSWNAVILKGRLIEEVHGGKNVKRKNQNKLTNHHITPRSRGGNSMPSNIAKVREREHRLYHALFENKTPVEVLDYLTDHFWNRDNHYVNHVYERNNAEHIEKAFSLVRGLL